jgi:Arc/MetJ-type ribon-helix-helix transcriptional regulator
MNTAKVAISLNPQMLRRVDALVKTRKFPSRSAAIQTAVSEKLARMDRNRLARECAKLSISAEQKLADEGLASDSREWPAY